MFIDARQFFVKNQKKKKTLQQYWSSAFIFRIALGYKGGKKILVYSLLCVSSGTVTLVPVYRATLRIVCRLQWSRSPHRTDNRCEVVWRQVVIFFIFPCLCYGHRPVILFLKSNSSSISNTDEKNREKNRRVSVGIIYFYASGFFSSKSMYAFVL